MRVGDIVVEYELNKDSKIKYNDKNYKFIGIILSTHVSTNFCYLFNVFEGYKTCYKRNLILVENLSITNLKLILQMFETVFSNEESIDDNFSWLKTEQQYVELQIKYLEYKQLERVYKLERLVK